MEDEDMRAPLDHGSRWRTDGRINGPAYGKMVPSCRFAVIHPYLCVGSCTQAVRPRLSLIRSSLAYFPKFLQDRDDAGPPTLEARLAVVSA